MPLTLVSLYGPKREPLRGLVARCRARIAASALAPRLEPYGEEQVHGTLCGLETVPGTDPPVSLHRAADGGPREAMDLDAVAGVVRDHVPMRIRFGGFPPGFDGFLSQGRTPYRRTFEIQESTGKVTLIGWPHRDGDFGGRALAALRADLDRRCRIGHKYGPDDNDLFVVLANLRAPATGPDPESIRSIERDVRDRLAASPIDVDLVPGDTVLLARYAGTGLDPRTTAVFDPTDPALDLSRLVRATGA